MFLQLERWTLLSQIELRIPGGQGVFNVRSRSQETTSLRATHSADYSSCSMEILLDAYMSSGHHGHVQCAECFSMCRNDTLGLRCRTLDSKIIGSQSPYVLNQMDLTPKSRIAQIHLGESILTLLQASSHGFVQAFEFDYPQPWSMTFW